jgi:hypothetical protein
MSSQNSSYPFQQGSRPRYITNQNQNINWWPSASRMIPRGGADMVVTLSDQSTHSTRSGYSDATDLSVPSATMSSSYDEPSMFDYEGENSPAYTTEYSAASSISPGSFGQSYPASFGRHEHEHREKHRETPSTLGWAQDSVLVKLYTFIVNKGREPYLQLQSEYRVTKETPQKVYLDRPK